MAYEGQLLAKLLLESSTIEEATMPWQDLPEPAIRTSSPAGLPEIEDLMQSLAAQTQYVFSIYVSKCF